MKPSNHEPKQAVQSVERAVEILLYLQGKMSGDGVSLAELSERFGLSKSTVFRLLDTLYRGGAAGT